MNIALDVPHHTAKGGANPGNADRGRGASAIKDGARLVYTATTMSEDEAERFGVPVADRRLYIRMDSGKVNITPPAAAAKWFRLVGVALGNGNDLYPAGDNVQTVEPWTAPETWEELTDTARLPVSMPSPRATSPGQVSRQRTWPGSPGGTMESL